MPARSAPARQAFSTSRSSGSSASGSGEGSRSSAPRLSNSRLRSACVLISPSAELRPASTSFSRAPCSSSSSCCRLHTAARCAFLRSCRMSETIARRRSDTSGRGPSGDDLPRASVAFMKAGEPRRRPRASALRPVRAVLLDALAVQRQRVVAQDEALFGRDAVLSLLDLDVDELLDAAAGQAHKVIVVRALVQLENARPASKLLRLSRPACSNWVSTR